MPQPLRLELFADLSSQLASGAHRSDVLGAAKVDEAHWEISQQFWLAKMADEATRSRIDVAQKYAAFYAAAIAKRAKAAALPAPPKPRPVSTEVVVHAIPLVAPPPSAPPLVGSVASVAPPTPLSYSARLSVEQLAAMRAEIVASEEAQHAAIKLRFGLDAPTWALEEAHWQRTLASNEDLFKRYLRQFQYCRALLRR